MHVGSLKEMLWPGHTLVWAQASVNFLSTGTEVPNTHDSRRRGCFGSGFQSVVRWLQGGKSMAEGPGSRQKAALGILSGHTPVTSSQALLPSQPETHHDESSDESQHPRTPHLPHRNKSGEGILDLKHNSQPGPLSWDGWSKSPQPSVLYVNGRGYSLCPMVWPMPQSRATQEPC